MHERVGVTVHEPPACVVAPEDQGHANRQILVRQISDDPVLPLDRNEDGELSRRVGLEDLELGLAPRK